MDSVIIDIIFAVVFIVLALVLMVFGCILLFDREPIGLALLLIGLLVTVIPVILIYDATKSVEKQFAEKQQAVIEAQRELEKFLIDHPELKEGLE